MAGTTFGDTATAEEVVDKGGVATRRAQVTYRGREPRDDALRTGGV